jgi:hypothetical protein
LRLQGKTIWGNHVAKADFDDVSLDTSSNEGDFEGFTPEDVIKAIEKGAQLKQIDDVDLSFISFDEDA